MDIRISYDKPRQAYILIPYHNGIPLTDTNNNMIFQYADSKDLMWEVIESFKVMYDDLNKSKIIHQSKAHEIGEMKQSEVIGESHA